MVSRRGRAETGGSYGREKRSGDEKERRRERRMMVAWVEFYGRKPDRGNKEEENVKGKGKENNGRKRKEEKQRLCDGGVTGWRWRTDARIDEKN